MVEGVAVSRVVIYNRIDCCAERLSNSVVSLLNHQGNTLTTYIIGDATNVPIFDMNGLATTASPTASPTYSPTTSKPTASPTAFPTAAPTFDAALVHKVRVQLSGTNTLNIREVQVFDTNGVNRALSKPATQSSTRWPYFASKAVNGIITIDGHEDMSHTEYEAGMYHEWTKSNLSVTAPFHSNRLTISLTIVHF